MGAYRSLNMPTTFANLGLKSPCETWHGRPTSSQVRPFLLPVVYHTKRSRNSEEHGRRGHHLGPAPNYPPGPSGCRTLKLARCVLGFHCVSPEFCVGTDCRAPTTEQGGRGERGGEELRDCSTCRCSGARKPEETSSSDTLGTSGCSSDGAGGAGTSDDADHKGVFEVGSILERGL